MARLGSRYRIGRDLEFAGGENRVELSRRHFRRQIGHRLVFLRLRLQPKDTGPDSFLDGRRGGANFFEIGLSLLDDLLYMVRQERRPNRKNIGD